MHDINLLNSLRFDYRLVLNAEAVRHIGQFINLVLHGIFRSTINIKTEEKTTAVINIVGNLIFALLYGKVIAISRNRNDFALQKFYGIKHYSYRNSISIVDYLRKESLINAKAGFYDLEANEGMLTRIWATTNLMKELNIYELTDKAMVQKINNKEFVIRRNSFEYLNHATPILLRDRNKNLMRYKADKRIVQMKNFVNEYNELMNCSSIIMPASIVGQNLGKKTTEPKISLLSSNITNNLRNGEEGSKEESRHLLPLLRTNEANSIVYNNLTAKLYRVFSRGDFRYGGRYYGAEYQQINKQDRKQILINGNKTVEGDYSGLHLNMLYHLCGLEFPGDPYLAVIDDPELRDLMKLVSLIAINAEKKYKAIRSINNARYEDWEFHQFLKFKNLKSNELFEMFENTHYKIANNFYNDEGVRLQNIDSQIAEKILKHFTKQGVPCLCIHDSFIVEEKYKDELEIVMQETYQKVMGHKIGIKFVS